MSDPQEQSTITLSSPKKIDIVVYRGDSGVFRITISDNMGAPIDISDAEWDGDIRMKPNDPDIITGFEFSPVLGDTSSVNVFLPPEKSKLISGKLVYDIEMKTGDVVTTLIYGNITAKQDVSRP